MKKILLYITIGLITLIQTACEEVVHIPLNNESPKLVIDANLTWQKEENAANQTIKLSLTNDFYSKDITIASGAKVTVTDENLNTFHFTQQPNTANYICTNFTPTQGATYYLKVVYNNQTYTASNKMLVTPKFNPVVSQTITKGIGGEDVIKLVIKFQDPANEDNFYLISAKNPNLAIREYLPLDDRFTQGNEMEVTYFNKNLKPNTNIKFTLQAITNTHYNYFKKLLSVSSQGSGSPFSTPAASVKGNIKNETYMNNAPFGFFSIGEIDQRTYTVINSL